MVDNIKIIDGGAVTSFVRAIQLAGGTYVTYSIPSKVDGTAYSAPATIALSMPVALPTDQIVSSLITNASVTTLISNASITANITNASLTASITNASLTATLINASVTTLISNASVTTLISNASVTTLISNAFITSALSTAYFTTGVPSAANTALAVVLSPNGINPNGSGTSAGAAPVVLANDQSALAVMQNTKWLANGNSTTVLVPAFGTVSMNTLGTASIVASNATAAIRVVALQLTNTTATNFKWQSGATDITAAASFTTNSGYVLPFNPVGWFQAAAGSALVGNSSASSAIGGSLTYILV